MDAELAHETRYHAEKRDVREKSRAHQVVKTVRAVGRQRSERVTFFDRKLPFRRVELRLEKYPAAVAVSLDGSSKRSLPGPLCAGAVLVEAGRRWSPWPWPL